MNCVASVPEYTFIPVLHFYGRWIKWAKAGQGFLDLILRFALQESHHRGNTLEVAFCLLGPCDTEGRRGPRDAGALALHKFEITRESLKFNPPPGATPHDRVYDPRRAP
jgi:hypothetical protein